MDDGYSPGGGRGFHDLTESEQASARGFDTTYLLLTGGWLRCAAPARPTANRATLKLAEQTFAGTDSSPNAVDYEKRRAAWIGQMAAWLGS